MSKFKIGDLLQDDDAVEYQVLDVIDPDKEESKFYKLSTKDNPFPIYHWGDGLFLKSAIYPFGQDFGKKYEYNGKPVRLICTDRLDSSANGYTYLWLCKYNDGEYSIASTPQGRSGDSFITEVSLKTDWSKVPIDTLVYCRNACGKGFKKRYYAGFHSGRPNFFANGTDSVTSTGSYIPTTDSNISLEEFND